LAVARYKIADVVFDADLQFGYTVATCRDYLYEGDEKPVFFAKVTADDIIAERKKDVLTNGFPDCYYESIALFRKLCDFILKNERGIIFHSSAVAVDGKAYLFTAPSGTGKSTHTRLWRELLGERAVMINDDKPIVKFSEGKFYVYGTPWMGKHCLGSNTRAEIKAICRIEQAKENSIKKLAKKDMLFTILNQTIRPSDSKDMDKLLSVTEDLLSNVDLYSLKCNISAEAAELSYKTMSGESI